ncbi:type II toxin-antitoxin system HicA family toxin [Anabaena sp. CCY 9910]|uniref:type II toxin-antitoxin system HicA family toxin n=1 Tax=Anabaena sp. CCY 9910 TaxID=3103870 RepID=UPI0039E0F54C
MKLPRDLLGEDLAKALARFEYVIDRQTGSHIRLTTQLNGEHHVTVPAHDPLKVGTLNAILRDVAEHLSLSRDELLSQLFS